MYILPQRAHNNQNSRELKLHTNQTKPIHIKVKHLNSNLVMFLDAYGSPREVTPTTLHEYLYDLVSIS